MNSKLAHRIVRILNDHRITGGVSGTLNQPGNCTVNVWGKPADTVDRVIELVRAAAADFPDLGEIIRKLEALRNEG